MIAANRIDRRRFKMIASVFVTSASKSFGADEQFNWRIRRTQDEAREASESAEMLMDTVGQRRGRSN